MHDSGELGPIDQVLALALAGLCVSDGMKQLESISNETRFLSDKGISGWHKPSVADSIYHLPLAQLTRKHVGGIRKCGQSTMHSSDSGLEKQPQPIPAGAS